MKTLLTSFLVLISLIKINAQSSFTCVSATPFCSSTANSFSSSTSTSAETGPDYGCLSSQPNPAWFYFKIGSPGTMDIQIDQTDFAGTALDVDFICWGPFTDPNTPCTDSLTSFNVIDCSYSTAPTEYLNIASASTDEYYLMMITNFSGMPGTVNFYVQGSSTATLSCSIVCDLEPDYSTPACVNGSLQLYSTWHFGSGAYSWTGPNSFNSSLQNPILTSISDLNEGMYYVNYYLDSTCNITDSVHVNIDSCGTLTGYVYGDLNNNCIQDTLESAISNVKIKVSQGTSTIGYAWTDPYGFYSFDLLPGIYTIEIIPDGLYTSTCPSSLPHSVTLTGGTITNENMAVDCNVIDVVASHISVSGIAFFPGTNKFMNPLIVSYGPICYSGIEPGKLKLILDPLISYVGPAYGSLAPTVVTAPTGDTLIWNVADFSDYSYYMWGGYTFEYTTSTSATIGDTVSVTLMVCPDNPDLDSTNNTIRPDWVVGNSYDPNNKLVLPQGQGAQGYIPATTSKLNYTINFQNTGTAPAHDVYILDTLDATLDPSTIQIIGSSHPMSVELSGNVLKFIFDHIMLPDSTSNEPESHGSVNFNIGLVSGLLPGTEIPNEANIFFDFNPPILTNTSLNTIELPMNIKEEKETAVAIYPNPANAFVSISALKGSIIKRITILNTDGKEVYHSAFISGNINSTQISLTKFSIGMYFISVETDQGTHYEKLIKQ